jgi:hypothetical protein
LRPHAFSDVGFKAGGKCDGGRLSDEEVVELAGGRQEEVRGFSSKKGILG